MTDYEYQLDLLLRSNQSELLYRMIGSTPLADLFFIGVVSPLAFISFAISTFCFVVLLRNKSRNNDVLHKYLLAYVFNNINLCIIFSLLFIGSAPRYSPWFYSMFARIHRCTFASMLVPVFITTNRAVEILIIFNMLGNFKIKFKQIGNFSWSITYVIILILSSIINVPFLRIAKTDAQLVDDLTHFNQTITFTYCAKDIFYNKIWINYSKAIATFFRDLVISCIELGFSIVLIVLFKRFLANKSRQISSTVHADALRPRDANFKRNTRTIAQFSVVSVIMNFVSLMFSFGFSFIYNNIIINEFSLIISLIIILKPLMTILVLYKIDKNVRSAFKLKWN